MTRTASPEPATTTILACAADSVVAGSVQSALIARGLRVRNATAPHGPGRIVVLISRAAVRDEAWLGSVAAVPPEVVVPVRIDDVSSVETPEKIRRLNWIIWSNEDRAAGEEIVFLAAVSDINLRRVTRSVESMAFGWNAGGRNKVDLIPRVGPAKAAMETVHRQVATNTLAAPDDTMAFVTSSLEYARRRRGVRRFRWARRSLLAAAVAVVVPVTIVTGRGLVAANHLQAGASAPLIEARPDLVAIKASGALISGLAHKSAPPVLFRKLVGELSRPWSAGVIGANGDSAVNGIAFGDTPSLVTTVDGRGTIAWWDTKTGGMVKRYALHEGPLYWIDSTADGTSIAAANDKTVIVVDNGGRRRRTLHVPGGIQNLALSGDARHVVVETADGLLDVDVGSSAAPSPIHVVGSVLALRQTADGRVLALAANGNGLVLVDCLSGRTVAQAAWQRPVYPSAAIGRDGSVLINAADGQLWWARAGLRLAGTGRAVPDALSGMAIADGNTAIVSSDAFGTTVFDPNNNLPLGNICTEYSHVLEVRTSPDGRLVSCNGRGTVDLTSLAGWAPQQRPSPAPQPAKFPLAAASSTGNVAKVTADTKGIVTLTTRDGGTIVLDPAATGFAGIPHPGVTAVLAPGDLEYSGRATAVAILPGGSTIAIGSSDGMVSELDVRSPSDYSIVGRWQLPGGGQVRRLAWAADQRTLLADTDTYRWREQSCAGCYLDLAKAFAHVAQRRWFCYGRSTLDIVTTEVAHLLDLRVCPFSSPAEDR
jgi:WD40 repeat protein